MKRNRFFAFWVACMTVMIAFAQGGQNAQWRYIENYKDMAIDQMRRYRIPASITLGQGLLESGAGKSRLATEAHNHFGIKVGMNWTGPYIVMADDRPNDRFRKYRSDDESYEDHSRFLVNGQRYRSLFNLKITDYKGWAHGLKKAGYATDPAYATKLIKIIEQYKLYRFDTGSAGEVIAVPTAPLVLEKQTVTKVTASGERYTYSLNQPLYKRNGVRFVYSQPGETWESMAQSHNLFLKELLAFNDLSQSVPMQKGTVVYLQRKKRQGAPGMEMYVFSDGERLRDVCQRFAVRQKSIEKLNGLPEGWVPQEGDRIILRKVK